MSNAAVTSAPGFVILRAIRRLLAAGLEVRSMLGGRACTAEVRAMVEAAAAQLPAGPSFIAGYPHHDAGWVDAAAGSEYLDDRLRLRNDPPLVEP